MHLTQSETKLRSLISPIQLSAADAVDSIAGTIFRKQLFSYGTWVNPLWWLDGEPDMVLNKDLAQKFKNNFDDKVHGSPIAVPLNHTGDVSANAGELIKLEVEDDGLYGYLDIRRPEVVADINNGLIFDVSIGFDWDYVGQKDKVHYGPTLYHVALVTEPYINDMSGFVEADKEQFSKCHDQYEDNLTINGQHSVIMLSKAKVEELKAMKKAKLSKVTNTQKFPVDITYKDAEGEEQTATLQPEAELEIPEAAQTEVEQQITDATAPNDDPDPADDPANPDDSEEEETEEDDAAELSRLRQESIENKASKAYSTLLSKGKILPSQKDAFMTLAKSETAAATVELSTDKGSKKTTVLELISVMLSAGATQVKPGEKGTGNKGKEGEQAELTAEQEARVKRMGFSVKTFKKQLKKGTISLKDIEEE